MVGRLLAWTFKERFANIKVIANVSCSTLFIHGECDGLIPAEHSLRLFERCRARKLLITPPRMEHNSNLFGDASYLAVPAIHFFGFPGYYTTSPPRMPGSLFESPERRARLRDQQLKQEQAPVQQWSCNCLGTTAKDHQDVNYCRQEHSVEDITIRFSNTALENVANQMVPGSGGDSPKKVHGAVEPSTRETERDYASDPPLVPGRPPAPIAQTHEDFPDEVDKVPPKADTHHFERDILMYQ